MTVRHVTFYTETTITSQDRSKVLHHKVLIVVLTFSPGGPGNPGNPGIPGRPYNYIIKLIQVFNRRTYHKGNHIFRDNDSFILSSVKKKCVTDFIKQYILSSAFNLFISKTVITNFLVLF